MPHSTLKVWCHLQAACDFLVWLGADITEFMCDSCDVVSEAAASSRHSSDGIGAGADAFSDGGRLAAKAADTRSTSFWAPQQPGNAAVTVASDFMRLSHIWVLAMLGCVQLLNAAADGKPLPSQAAAVDAAAERLAWAVVEALQCELRRLPPAEWDIKPPTRPGSSDAGQVTTLLLTLTTQPVGLAAQASAHPDALCTALRLAGPRACIALHRKAVVAVQITCGGAISSLGGGGSSCGGSGGSSASCSGIEPDSGAGLPTSAAPAARHGSVAAGHSGGGAAVSDAIGRSSGEVSLHTWCAAYLAYVAGLAAHGDARSSRSSNSRGGPRSVDAADKRLESSQSRQQEAEDAGRGSHPAAGDAARDTATGTSADGGGDCTSTAAADGDGHSAGDGGVASRSELGGAVQASMRTLVDTLERGPDPSLPERTRTFWNTLFLSVVRHHAGCCMHTTNH